jgi:hypothetical protein
MIDFANKTVAVIGNSESLFQQNYGNKIDDHEIVCRINRGIPIFPEQGKKFSCLFYTNENLISDLIELIPKDVYKINTNTIDDNLKFILKQKLNLKTKKQKPSTGFLVISYIIGFHPVQVNIFGFDWKKTKTFYEKDYYNIDNINWDSHNFLEEEKIIKEIYCKNNNCKVYE